jgi:threonine dehydratase
MVAVSADAIRAALPRIPAAFRDMPQFVSEPLSERLGVPVVVKAETVNPIGCFKGRGTWLAVSELVAAGEVGERRGLVVASAGNFGQGVAYAARARDIPLVVFAAKTANPAKVAAMRRLGAEVRLAGEDFDAAGAAAAAYVAESAWRLVIDGVDPWTTIGAGTMAVELTDAVEAGDLPALAALYVPVCDGALIGGVGTWLRQAAPETRVIGVQSAAAPAVALSWRAGRAIETDRADTVADGLAARVPLPEALAIMATAVDDMQLVEERAILDAQAELSAALPFTVEPSAAVGWAAMRAAPAHAGAVGLILTGGNVPPPEDGRQPPVAL